MSQGSLSVASGSGAAVRAGFNAAIARLASKGSGTSRPSDIVAGEHWIETDNPGAGVWALWLFDGGSDILDGIIDTVNHEIYRVTGQLVSLTTGAMATGTTQIPSDDTIPQNTEGDQYMSLEITPIRAASKLKIDVVWHGASSAAGGHMTAALLRDSAADALAASSTVPAGAGGVMVNIKFTHIMDSPGTSAVTFKVRVGLNTAGTTTFNGVGGARRYGGVMASSITIEERLA